MDEEIKTFKQLCDENASCLEFAWCGFIRLYEKEELKCKCKDCVLLETHKEN